MWFTHPILRRRPNESFTLVAVTARPPGHGFEVGVLVEVREGHLLEAGRLPEILPEMQEIVDGSLFEKEDVVSMLPARRGQRRATERHCAAEERVLVAIEREEVGPPVAIDGGDTAAGGEQVPT